MKGREGRTAFITELQTLGIPDSFIASDRDDVSVYLPEIGWKSKSVEIIEFNRPESIKSESKK